MVRLLALGSDNFTQVVYADDIGIFYMQRSSYLFRVANDLKTYTSVGCVPSGSYPGGMLAARAGGAVFVTTTDFTSDGAMFWQSTDQGDSWTQKTGTVSQVSKYWRAAYASRQSAYVLVGGDAGALNFYNGATLNDLGTSKPSSYEITRVRILKSGTKYYAFVGYTTYGTDYNQHNLRRCLSLATSARTWVSIAPTSLDGGGVYGLAIPDILSAQAIMIGHGLGRISVTRDVLSDAPAWDTSQPDADFTGIYYGSVISDNLDRWAVCGEDGQVMVSYDGVSWQKVTPAGGYVGTFYDVAYAADIDTFMFVGQYGEVQYLAM
ncbi:hypothetical protein DENIS_3451 [Desulfonema ishimotonii]|uniref:Glycosyl hydrolase n=2 Tax=Desulfonema ishimotonii TaxID=45657 RepID=A0A401FZS2_9BACT|nr:hypothetical protein DENIS_3451 [Desulfonema ishimotonii]